MAFDSLFKKFQKMENELKDLSIDVAKMMQNEKSKKDGKESSLSTKSLMKTTILHKSVKDAQRASENPECAKIVDKMQDIFSLR